jgi:hypothetical protein
MGERQSLMSRAFFSPNTKKLASIDTVDRIDTFRTPTRTSVANVLATIPSGTEEQIAGGTVDARAAIVAADTAATAANADLFLPAGTYRVASNLTIVNRVQFGANAKVKPDSGVSVTFGHGYVAEEDDHVFDITAGGTIVLRNQAVTSIEHFGAKHDYEYPNTGTDNSATIQACFNAVQEMAMAASFPARVRPQIIAPAGRNYRILTPLQLDDWPDLDMRGSWLRYRGTIRTGGILTIGHVTPGRYAYYGKYSNLRVDGVATDLRFTPTEAKNWSGIRLANCANCSLENPVSKNVPVSIALWPWEGGLVSTNPITNPIMISCKTGIQLRGSPSVGYVNENIITHGDFTLSAVATFGSTYGVVYMADAGGYTGQNNNRIENPTFQIGNYEPAMNITVGKTVESGYWYVTRSNNSEYYCSATGTGVVATVPTHTSGTVTDANGVAFEYVGPFFRVPIVYDESGSYNRCTGARWESGDGPFVWVKSSSVVVKDNEHDVYTRGGNPRDYPMVDFVTGRTSNIGYSESTRVRIYSQPDTTSTVLNNLHKRFIRSATGTCIKGCFWHREGGANQNVQFCTGNAKLLRESVYYDSLTEAQWTWFGFLVDLTHYKGITVAAHEQGNVDFGSLYLSFFDEKFNRIAISGTSDVSVGLGSWTFYDAGDAFQFIDLFGSVRKIAANAKYAFIGQGYNGFESTGISIYPTWDGLTFEGFDSGVRHHSPFMPVAVRTPYEADSNSGDRFSHGTPLVGYFESVGERIQNINTASGQPMFWLVKTSGILAPAWTSSTASIRKDELRSNAGNVYYANTAGTSGTTAPTGTTTSNDGSIVWTYLGPVAVLQASSQAYDISAGSTEETFESVSQNLKTYPSTINYTSNKVTSIVYTLPGATTITKTINYTGDKITSIVLSGSTPSGITLTKTLSYTSNNLTGVSYA